MKVSLNWLSELVQLPASVPQLCELLTQAGVEVEGIHTRGVSIEKVVVAQVLESLQHPNADRLSVCQIDDGSGSPRQIVCGAKNYKVGDKVPVALPGAVLPGDFKIKVGKLRGVESLGMLCSAKELGLAEDAEGLLILSPEAKPGTPMTELFPAETILEVEVTPNRPDLLSHVGMAREIAALTGNPLKNPAIGTPSTQGGEIVIHNQSVCPFYSARKITGVKVGPSPAWLREKLEAVGLRAINNIVDVTNYVMFELGQPLHAFDAAKLKGALQVRTANEGEEFLALDGRTYSLNPEQLVIADQQRAVAIAGVMGGEETGVTETTTEVILESAYFQPSSIRRTARNLALGSDSSYRFERGVDPEGVLPASQRAIDLILQVAGGEEQAETIVAGSLPDFTCTISLRPNRCSEILGTQIPEERATGILASLGLIPGGSNSWKIPSFRQDLRREIDLIEEVTRVYGIENIPGRELGRFTPSSATDLAHDRQMNLRRALIGQGFYEARTLTLVGENTGLCNVPTLRVKNPLVEDQVVLRSDLIGGLLGVVANNTRGGTKSVRIFEIGRVFTAGEKEESTHLGLVMTGESGESSWRSSGETSVDFYDLKGVLGGLGFGDLSFESTQSQSLALAVEIRSRGVSIGFAGQLWPAKARELDITAPLLAAEINLDALQTLSRGRYQEINKFPAVTRDIALIVPLEMSHEQIAGVLEGANEVLLESVKIFDVFTDPTGGKIAADRKSLAYSLTYRAKDRTLTSDEVNAAHARLKERLKLQLGVQFRE